MKVAVTALLFFSLTHAVWAATPGKNDVEVRGKTQYLFYYPAQGIVKGTILFIPGDGGWHGFALTIAEKLSGFGYSVYGLDTRRYLTSFNSFGGLTDENIANDIKQFAGFTKAPKILVVGWSEGAGMALVAASNRSVRDTFKGIIAVGCTEKNVRMLKWSDLFAEATRQTPNEPIFACSSYASSVSPLPLSMIQSANDEYVSRDETQKIFARAVEPKQLIVIDAANHHFGGRETEFFQALQKALEWTIQTPVR